MYMWRRGSLQKEQKRLTDFMVVNKRLKGDVTDAKSGYRHVRKIRSPCSVNDNESVWEIDVQKTVEGREKQACS